MIFLRKLKWSNCFSYGENNEIDFSKDRLVQIVGTNGVGKSSIPLILEEVLFNKNSKGIKKGDIANRNKGPGYSISLWFSKDEDEYEVHVDRKSSAKVVLLRNGEDISSHTATNTYKTIQDTLGVDFKTFSQIVYQSTNSSLQFLTATDTNRKKFLIDLLNLDYYMKFFELFKKLTKETSDSLQQVEGRLTTLRSWLEKNNREATEVLPLLKIPKYSKEAEEEIRTLQYEIENISQKNRKIQSNNQYKNLLKSINITDLRASEYTKELSDEEVVSQVGALKSQLDTAKTTLKKLESLGDVCHTCEQDVSPEFKASHIQELQDTIADLTVKLTKLVKEREQISQHNKQVKEVQKQISEWEKLYKLVDSSLPSEIVNETDLSDRLSQLKAQLAQEKKEIAAVEAENKKRIAHNTRIEVVQEQTDGFKKEEAECEEQKAKLEQKNTDFEILKKAFSTNGLVAYKIENLVKELEELTNEYLAELSDGRFTLEFVVQDDKLNVNITDNSKPIDILALSSGELARVNTATLIAIRRLMSSISKSEINVLFLDEVINVLDEQGREKIVEILLNEDLNTYLVSHGWTHPLLAKIEVVKQNNISRLEL